ncbi:MAG TPA: PPC domain-containing protein [Planctomycetaceae bacterium]|nr:PPC domain-containing protein [Planctomycetaceae bacterium]
MVVSPWRVVPYRRPVLGMLVAAVSLGWSGVVLSAPPVLSHLFPAGGQRGAKVIVTSAGDFAWPVGAWASGLEIAPTADSGKVEITIPADLPADRIWIRLFNAEGASATVPFLIGSLPELEEREPNNSPRTAQALPSPQVTINGVLLDGDLDGYAVKLEAGQTLVAAVDANTRLGSPIDAILQIASADGTVLAENHDDFQLDPRLAYTATRPGTYIVRLFAFPSTPGTKIALHGAANCVYRLTLTTGRYITHALPLAVPKSEPGTVEVRGWNIPPGTRLPVASLEARPGTVPEFEAQSDLRISPDARPGLAFAGDFAGAARVRLMPDPIKSLLAPGDSAGPLSLPTCLTGWFQKAGQSDVHRLPLQKGQTLIATVESQTLGLALDPLVQLADPAGAVVAEIDDTGAMRDPVVVHRATQDGEYRLTIRDRYRQGGERCCYLLTVRLEEPDFELSAAVDAIVVTAGKPTEIPIKVQRRTPPEGTVGPITIEAVGLPAGVEAAAVVSEPTGPTATDVKLTLTASGPAYSGPFRIVGKASQPRALERSVRTPAKLGASLETIWLTVIVPNP